MDDFYSEIAATVHQLLSEAGIEFPQSDIDPAAVSFVEAIATMAHEYADQRPSLEQAAEAATVEERYSVKGESTYRGYYHPSPAQELIITNMTRGRLVKKPPLSGSYYQYGLNADGNLLSVRQYDKKKLAAVEYLIRPTETEEYGLLFENDLLAVGTKTVYENGRPIAFGSVMMPLNLNCMNSFEFQTFVYDGDRLTEVTYENGVYGQFSRKEHYRVIDDGNGLRLDESHREKV